MNQLYVFDFTLSCDKCNLGELKKSLKDFSKKWTFQKEKGEGGYLHWQGRVSLKSKMRISELIKTQLHGIPYHWSPTSNENKNNTFYVTKIDSRIEGPWCDKDIELYIPKQVREMVSLYPFQKSIIEKSTVWDKRHINWVYQPVGNVGKSSLCSYMRAHKLGRPIPPLNDYKDVMRMVYDVPTDRCYLFDMPKALKKDKLRQLIAAIETIKDGYAFDDRYGFKEKIFDCPNIWVFSNRIPDLSTMSYDRWLIWTIKNKELIKYQPFDDDETDILGEQVL